MHDYAQIAANWWADRLFIAGPQDQRITRRDGRDRASEESEVMVNLFATLGAANKHQPPPEARAKFVAALASAIEALPKPLSICVDYHPDAILARAAAACGHTFGMTDWPYKTNMRVDLNGVRAAHGYGSPWVDLTPKP